MEDLPVRFYHDFVDPASYLVDRALRTLEPEGEVRRIPFEIRSPDAPLIDPRTPEWRRYVAEMAEAAEEAGVAFRAPAIVPWSRKAHELSLHGRRSGTGEELDRSIYRAFFEEGRDIGRVDVLVEIGAAAGLDRTETKAVLDVDRFRDEIESERAAARERGVRGVPTISAGDAVLEGFHREEEIRTFLKQRHRP